MEEQIRRLEERIQRERYYRQEELIRDLENLYRRDFISNRMRRTVLDYVTLLCDHFRTTENPMTRLPSMRRFNENLVVCECTSITLARFGSTPWQIRFRFRFTISIALPNLERTPVGIRGRRRTQLASRPQVRRQVIRVQSTLTPHDESDNDFNNIVRAMLNSYPPYQGGSSNDSPPNDGVVWRMLLLNDGGPV